jgi:hypothetical protein
MSSWQVAPWNDESSAASAMQSALVSHCVEEKSRSKLQPRVNEHKGNSKWFVRMVA